MSTFAEGSPCSCSFHHILKKTKSQSHPFIHSSTYLSHPTAIFSSLPQYSPFPFSLCALPMQKAIESLYGRFIKCFLAATFYAVSSCTTSMETVGSGGKASYSLSVQPASKRPVHNIATSNNKSLFIELSLLWSRNRISQWRSSYDRAFLFKTTAADKLPQNAVLGDYGVVPHCEAVV